MSDPRICFNALFLSTLLWAATPNLSLAQTGSGAGQTDESRPAPSSNPRPQSQPETRRNKDFTLADGAVVKLRLMRDLSSSEIKVEDPVEFEVIEDVKLDGVVVIPRGAKAEGSVIDARAARRMGRSGRIGVRLDYVSPATGERLPLRAVSARSDGSRAGQVASDTTIAATFFFPAAPFFLLKKGKEVTIPKGTLVTSFIEGDHRLDREAFVRANEQRQ